MGSGWGILDPIGGVAGSAQALPASAFPSNYVSIKMQISYNARNGGLVVIATRGEETGLHLPSSHPFRTNWGLPGSTSPPCSHPRLRVSCPKVDFRDMDMGNPAQTTSLSRPHFPFCDLGMTKPALNSDSMLSHHRNGLPPDALPGTQEAVVKPGAPKMVWE